MRDGNRRSIMKKRWLLALFLLSATLCAAQPIRVAVLDFDDQTGQASDPLLGGLVKSGSLAQKGIFLLGQKLLGNDNFVLIDRRDFIDQIEKLKPKDMGEKTPTKPSFIHAAQALKADVVLRGSLLAFSTGKQLVNQGGIQTDFSTLSARVGIEALDARDGTVIAMSNGTAEKSFRQTKEVTTVLSENDALGIIDDAVGKALPAAEKALKALQARDQTRPMVKISVKTSADPALVEIDGILIGSSPLDGFEVYKGDHVLSIGKPGYQGITKRILMDKDMKIESPMLRVQLSADEVKEIMEKMKINVVVGEPAFVITPLN
jgi:hypothetical protein